MTLAVLVENAAPFVFEEVAALRDGGLPVRVASVFRPTRPESWEQLYGEPVLYPAASRAGWAGHALRDGAREPQETASLLRLARDEGAPLRLVTLAGFLARSARREGWSHVHGSFATFPAWTAAAVAKLAGIPFSFTGHAYDVQQPRPWLARLLREAAFVRAISHEGAARLRAQAGGPCRVRVGHLGVDVARFRPQDAGDGIPEILSVAHLGPTKGHAILLEACARLVADPSRGRFHLRLLGDGPERAALEGLCQRLGIRDRVVFEGAASRDRVLRATARACLFALPCRILPGRRHDGLPVAILEALAAGLPVVSTPVGGIPEAVRDGVNGRLVPVDDVASLADVLGRLLADAAERRRLGQAARAVALDLFRQDEAAARLARWVRQSSGRIRRSSLASSNPRSHPRQRVDGTRRLHGGLE